MKLLILDVDGTLVECKSGATFRKTADDWQWLPGRIEKLKALRDQGVKIALATNQAGVAFPWSKFTEAEMQAEIEAVAREIGAEYIGVCATRHQTRRPCLSIVTLMTRNGSQDRECCLKRWHIMTYLQKRRL